MNIAIFLLQIILQLIALRVVFKLGQTALAVFVVLEAVLANLFVLKQIELFGLYVTASDSFIIGSMIGLALYQEYFGKQASKALTLVTFGSLFFVTALSWLHLQLSPSVHDLSQPHYQFIFAQTPRLAISSLVSYFLASRADIALFQYLKSSTSWKFHNRALVTTLVSQAIDTIVFSFLALYGILDNLLHIILFSFIIKALCLITYLILQPRLVKPQVV